MWRVRVIYYIQFADENRCNILTLGKELNLNSMAEILVPGHLRLGLHQFIYRITVIFLGMLTSQKNCGVMIQEMLVVAPPPFPFLLPPNIIILLSSCMDLCYLKTPQ